MNPFSHTGLSISDSLKSVRKSVLIYETIIPVTTLAHILNEYPQIEENLRVPEKEYPIRLWYMFKREVCTIIDVDERSRKVKIYNYTNNFIKKAFGRNEKPTFEEYEKFLESRCFPRQRDKIKLVLEDLNLPFMIRL